MEESVAGRIRCCRVKILSVLLTFLYLANLSISKEYKDFNMDIIIQVVVF